MLHKRTPVFVRFWRHAKKGKYKNSCWKWKGYTDCAGYGSLLNDSRKLEKASHISWRLHFPNISIPSKIFVCHRCDNPPCTNPNHLFLGTQTDNMRDCASKGRAFKAFGDAHCRALMTANLVRKLRKLWGTHNYSLKQLSSLCGIKKGTIWCAVTHKSWKHL